MPVKEGFLEIQTRFRVFLNDLKKSKISFDRKAGFWLNETNLLNVGVKFGSKR